MIYNIIMLLKTVVYLAAMMIKIIAIIEQEG